MQPEKKTFIQIGRRVPKLFAENWRTLTAKNGEIPVLAYTERRENMQNWINIT